MIEIKKGREPESLIKYRQQKDASYEQMDRCVKEDLMRHLLREQGHVCAYCMKRISYDVESPWTGINSITIEHWYPRNPENNEGLDRSLDYKNMFAVCSGNRGCGFKDGMTCDAHKGNAIIKVNPCDINTLAGISYTSAGRIQSSDPIVNEDIDKTLNLNCERVSLPENRKQALQTLINDIHKKHTAGDISTYCKRKLDNILNMDDPKMPYVGILIWWLKKHAQS